MYDPIDPILSSVARIENKHLGQKLPAPPRHF